MPQPNNPSSLALLFHSLLLPRRGTAVDKTDVDV
jgi:hypothetical protein